MLGRGLRPQLSVMQLAAQLLHARRARVVQQVAVLLVAVRPAAARHRDVLLVVAQHRHVQLQLVQQAAVPPVAVLPLAAPHRPKSLLESRTCCLTGVCLGVVGRVVPPSSFRPHSFSVRSTNWRRAAKALRQFVDRIALRNRIGRAWEVTSVLDQTIWSTNQL